MTPLSLGYPHFINHAPPPPSDLCLAHRPRLGWLNRSGDAVLEVSIDFFYGGLGGVKMEPMDIVGKSKEDASLSKEFINLISSESNEVCNREDKRTIEHEHVLKVLEVLGFGEYIEDVYAAYEQHKLETMQDSLKAGKWSNAVEMTEEQAAAEQQRMFAEARSRMNGGAAAPKQPESDCNLNS